MSTHIKIPTNVLNRIIENTRLKLLDEKSQSKLIKKIIELWMFIYNKQIGDESTISLKGYTNIDKSELDKFNIQIDNKRIRYRELLDMLYGLVETNDKYKKGSFTKGYRIITDNFNGNTTEVEIDINKIFHNIKSKEYWITKYPEHQHLIEWTYKSSIDLDEYLKWMLNNEGMKLKPITNKGILMDRFLNRERIWHHFFLSLKINIGDLWFKVSDEGRLYSSISNLPYTSVPYIKLYMNDTCDIDIKNCQPLLLSKLLNNCKGAKEYKRDVENGIFYDRVAHDMGIERLKFKALSYKLIFFNDKPLLGGKVYESMIKLYGDVIYKINELKKDGKLSLTLQKMESEIIVDGIGKLNIPKLLRHDQVICLKDNKKTIEQELIKQFNNINLNVNF